MLQRPETRDHNDGGTGRLVSVETSTLRSGDALVVVDVQNDFLPGGALAVPEGDAVIGPLNACIAACQRHRLPIFATRDWHPSDHCSFRTRGGPWPVHCLIGSAGAAFAKELALPADTHLISKGMSSNAEAYSGFDGTDMAAQLRACGCQRVVIGGLATDYCVRATALDALRAGLQVIVLVDAVRAVDARPGDGQRALAELRERGVQLERVGTVAAVQDGREPVIPAAALEPPPGEA